jgi:hypothetical protein
LEKSPPLPRTANLFDAFGSSPDEISPATWNAIDSIRPPVAAKPIVNLTLTAPHVGDGYKYL